MIGKLNGSAERLAVALRDVIADAVEPGQSKLQSQMDELRKEMADRFRQHREDVAGDMSQLRQDVSADVRRILEETRP